MEIIRTLDVNGKEFQEVSYNDKDGKIKIGLRKKCIDSVGRISRGSPIVWYDDMADFVSAFIILSNTKPEPKINLESLVLALNEKEAS